MNPDKSEESSPNSSVHSQNIQRMLSGLIVHLRQDYVVINEPRFGALLETSAEVLAGLKTAFEHYEQEKEHAGKR
jgi:hypothetical protein